MDFVGEQRSRPAKPLGADHPALPPEIVRIAEALACVLAETHHREAQAKGSAEH